MCPFDLQSSGSNAHVEVEGPWLSPCQLKKPFKPFWLLSPSLVKGRQKSVDPENLGYSRIRHLAKNSSRNKLNYWSHLPSTSSPNLTWSATTSCWNQPRDASRVRPGTSWKTRLSWQRRANCNLYRIFWLVSDTRTRFLVPSWSFFLTFAMKTFSWCSYHLFDLYLLDMFQRAIEFFDAVSDGVSKRLLPSGPVPSTIPPPSLRPAEKQHLQIRLEETDHHMESPTQLCP